MTAPSPTSPGEPRRLGSAYVLTSLIGTGAQGEVWLGRRVDGPAINLAVKLLRADLLQFGEIVFNLRYQPAGGRIVQNRYL